ncbi:hypothetical protein E4U60_004532 [Claviceps pazoutovae]|uniref:Suppressor of anucleate metulae protein B n=1 Tax=Claviceps pazoutovae TaxID=1649127 RepID=A0A9P7M8T0_9HYPO|nr:hypothetical protein E4U60_004532 [Claviceps pazoutovae]
MAEGESQGTSAIISAAETSMYALQDVSGKGKGLIATRHIPRGTRILAEKALISLPKGMYSGKRDDLIRQQVEALTNDQRDAFLSMRNIHPFENLPAQCLGIIQTNALPAQEYPDTQAIFLEACRINHDCQNNAIHQWNANIEQGTVHAMRDIQPGEEITISYVFSLKSRETRQKQLKDSFDFTCSCRLCSLPKDESEERDRKLEQIVSLDQLTALQFTTPPLQTLAYFYTQTRLYSELGREDIGFAQALEEAACLVIAHGDLARGRVFSERAHSIWTTIWGSDSPRAILWGTRARDLSLHERFGYSMSWKTAADEVPQELGPDDFENWLWKRELQTELAQPANLSSQSRFSGFADLPCNTDAGTTTGCASNKRHWCLLGEIVEDIFLHPLEFEIKDMQGHKVPLHFYTKDRGSELTADQVKRGYTVAVLDASKHVFKLRPPGIRHEDPRMIKSKSLVGKIFPLSLAEMLALELQVRQFSIPQHNGFIPCHGCGTNAAPASMKRCGKCLSFWYCNKECQMAGWTTKAHKGDCKFLKDPDLRGLFLINWDEIQGSVQFPLQPSGCE